MAPMTASPALRNFFHPVDPTEIADAAARGRRLFRKTERASEFARLLPWETLNSLITSEALTSGRIALARQGRMLPLEMAGAAVRSRTGDWISPEAVQTLCAQGMSLVLNDVERQVAAIAAMNAMVERYLRCDTITNAYVSFNRDSAFKAHFDPHNVLILQLQGRKRWWCHGQVQEHPLEARAFTDLSELPDVEWEGVLEPGDILFLPRGDIHHALVEDAHSLHLTVTLTPPMGADVLAWLRGRGMREELGRRYLPVNASADVARDYQASLRTLLVRLVDSLDIPTVLDEMDHARAPFRPFNLGKETSLRPEAKVQPALRRRVALPEAIGGEVRIALGGAMIRLSPDERDVLSALLEADLLTLGQLAEMFPDIDVVQSVGDLARKSLVFLGD